MVILVMRAFFCVGCPCGFCRQLRVYVLKKKWAGDNQGMDWIVNIVVGWLRDDNFLPPRYFFRTSFFHQIV
jgi:hypothetical protein